MTTQINKLKSKGHIILMGDFNAKLEVNKIGIEQKISRNGTCLQRTIDQTQTTPISLKANKGTWTRVNRKKTSEKSIIDYVIMTTEIAQSTTMIHIDEEGTLRLKGKEESDHNTIVIETTIPTQKRVTREKILNIKDPKGWKKFNNIIGKKFKKHPPETYNQYEKVIKETMKQSFRKITVTKGQYKYKLGEQAKSLKTAKKMAKKEFQQANKENKLEKLDVYIKSQKALRQELENIEKERVEQRLNVIIKEGGAGSDHFWKIRKKILNQGRSDNYDIINEEGKKITDPEESKEHIANFYENLYKAREGTKAYQEWTDHIEETVKQMEKKTLQEEEDFTNKEMKIAIRSLKRGKSTGPDGIPNEVFIESDENTRETHREIMNKIMRTIDIPEQWKEGDLKRLYKGKGIKGKCSNERGITLASNVGKMFERLVNNRIVPRVDMSDAQAGGTKKRATVDHILILKELTNICKKKKKQLILVYLDVTKAYDKAWLDGIMYVLQKRGIQTNLWRIVKELNSDLKTTIQTKHGPTRKIKITDSIRQGGVLSVTMYALMMDETNKALKETDLGIEIPGTDTKIPCLLWMDDVVLIEIEEDRVQEELDITNHTSLKYHVEYGMPKTKYLRIGGSTKTPLNLKIGEKPVEETDKYTYLGEINNRRMNLTNQIEAIGRKVEAAYQTLIAITEDREFKGIKMASVWLLVNTCIIPIITYASETWSPNKQEQKKLNQTLDKIIRRILMTPESTPREALYIETGLLDVETIAESKRMNMKARLNRNRSEMMDKVLQNKDSQWEKENAITMEKYGITQEDLIGSKFKTKSVIRRKIHQGFKKKMTETSQGKTKIGYFREAKSEWSPGTRAKYMNELTRKQASLIFKTRTRMMKIRANYKNGHKDQTCRACKKEPETQDHALEKCPELHRDDETKVPKSELFTENTDTLRKAADKIEKIIGKFEQVYTG